MLQYWLQPAATLTASLLVLLSAGLTVRQRHRADAKDQWWKRTQWAIDLALAADDQLLREVGLLVADEQARSRLADAEDGQLLDVVASRLVPDIPRLGETHSEERGGDG